MKTMTIRGVRRTSLTVKTGAKAHEGFYYAHQSDDTQLGRPNPDGGKPIPFICDLVVQAKDVLWRSRSKTAIVRGDCLIIIVSNKDIV